LAINSSLNPLPYVSAASKRVTPRSNALCMSAIASPSVKFPHQPVEIVHKPKPTSLTVRSVFLQVRNFIPWGADVQRLKSNFQHSIKALDVGRWALDVF